MKKVFLLVILLAVGSLAFISCKKDKYQEPDESKPKDGITIGSKDWHEVPLSGCTIELNDISLTIPENTFSEDTKISVTKLKSGSYYGTSEASNFYYITVPPQVNNSISVTLTPSQEGTNVQYAALAPFHRKSTNEDVTGGIDLDCSYDDGKCIILLPTSNNDDEGENLWIIVGLVEDNSSSSSSSEPATRKMTDLTVTPAGQVKNVKWHYAMDTWLWLKMSGDETVKINNLMNTLTPIVTDALTKIHDLGFVLDEERNIPICFIRDTERPNAFGFFNQSYWSDRKSTVEINLEKIDKDGANTDALKATCIHELLHYFQADYDKRSSKKKKIPGEEDILNEAASVWVEQFMYNGKLDAKYLSDYISGYFRGFYISENGNKPAEQGYGMASLLYYLTSPISDLEDYGINKNSIVELFQIWKDNPEYRGTSYLTLTKWFSDHQCFFMDYYYDEFLLAVLTGKVFDLVKIEKGNIEGIDLSSNMYTFNTDRTYTYPTRTCLGLGCAIDLGNVFERTSFEGKEIIIKQEKPDVKTYLIVRDNDYNYEYYKTPATLENPLVIKGEEIDKMLKGAHKSNLYFVTINTFSAKKDYTVTCTIQDKKENDTVPNITYVFLKTQLEVGTEDNHGMYYSETTFNEITINKTTTGYTVTATSNDDSNSIISIEVDNRGATPVITQMTMNVYRSYGDVSAVLTNIPCASRTDGTQFFNAYESENTLHISSFSYNGPFGSCDHIVKDNYSRVEVKFLIDL